MFSLDLDWKADKLNAVISLLKIIFGNRKVYGRIPWKRNWT
jgi:hypothetical protein